jgi:hypothetical protein
MSIRWASDVNPIRGDRRASSAIPRRFVDTLSGFRCIRRVSFRGPHDPTPRFPPRGPPVCVGVPALRRYYQGAATPCRPSRRAWSSFAWRYRRCVRAASLPPAARTRGPAGPGSLGFGQPVPRSVFDGDGWISQVPGEPPLHLRRALRPRQDQGRLTDCDAPARPPRRERRGLLHCRFRGSIPRLWCSLSTLRPGGHPPRTPDSLPAAGQALPGGLPPAGFQREVSECFLTPHPPLPSLLGAIPHSGQRPGVARRS